MALSSAFNERLHHMDRTRMQRLSLLQAEKELQANKSRILASKLATIRATEQKCLVLDQKIASQNFRILSLKSQIENLEVKYESVSQEFRSLQNEVEELEELHKKKDSFYESKRNEMKEFKEIEEKFVVKCRMEVETLRNRVNERNIQSIFELLDDLRNKSRLVKYANGFIDGDPLFSIMKYAFKLKFQLDNPCFPPGMLPRTILSVIESLINAELGAEVEIFLLRLSFTSNNRNSCNSEIAAAEMRRSELLAEKECVCRNVASNHQIKANLQKQLQSILITQT